MNFLIMALVVFVIVKAVNKATEKLAPKQEETPTTKTCPYCRSQIAIEATRCPHCTSVLEEEMKDKIKECDTNRL